MVSLEKLDDAAEIEELRQLVKRHAEATRAASAPGKCSRFGINWFPKFVRVMPNDYKRRMLSPSADRGLRTQRRAGHHGRAFEEKVRRRRPHRRRLTPFFPEHNRLQRSTGQSRLNRNGQTQRIHRVFTRVAGTGQWSNGFATGRNFTSILSETKLHRNKARAAWTICSLLPHRQFAERHGLKVLLDQQPHP